MALTAHSIYVIPATDNIRPDQEREESELVSAARNGEMAALAELYRRFAPSLMAVAYRMLASREAAEDVLHDVFVGLPEALRKYDERGRLAGWLKRITARVAVSALRHEEVVARHSGLLMQTHTPDPHTLITLESAVASLPASLRAVLVLKEIEGFNHAEIASMLGISKGASEVRLHRAIAALRSMIAKGESS